MKPLLFFSSFLFFASCGWKTKSSRCATDINRCNSFQSSESQFYLGTDDSQSEGIGHEAITYFAMQMTASLAEDAKKKEFFTPRAPLQGIFRKQGTQLRANADPIVQGNAANDWIMPGDYTGAINLFPDLYNYYHHKVGNQKNTVLNKERTKNGQPPLSVSSWTTGYQWWYEPRLYMIHFLRDDHDPKNIPNLAETCSRAREHIQLAADRAKENLLGGNEHVGKLWMGSATHTIQDSFSNDHVKRGPANYTLSEDFRVANDKAIGDVSVSMQLRGGSNISPNTVSDDLYSRIASKTYRMKAAQLALQNFAAVHDICSYDQPDANNQVCMHVRHTDNEDPVGDMVWRNGNTGSLEGMKDLAIAAVFATYEFLSTVYYNTYATDGDESSRKSAKVDLSRFFRHYMNCTDSKNQ